jgi:hypothetical protein
MILIFLRREGIFPRAGDLKNELASPEENDQGYRPGFGRYSSARSVLPERLIDPALRQHRHIREKASHLRR